MCLGWGCCLVGVCVFLCISHYWSGYCCVRFLWLCLGNSGEFLGLVVFEVGLVVDYLC